MSVDVGQTVSFKVDNTSGSSYHIDILRLGYYGGDGARQVVSDMSATTATQPSCLIDSSTGSIDCGNWSSSASWTVPSNAVSGVYVAHLVRNDNGAGSLIPFVVRNDASTSNILYQTSDATWEAYNSYGGNSLYTCSVDCPPGNPLAYKGADAVSYNRPFNWGFSTNNGASSLFYAEYQMIYWLEQQGYDVSYTSSAEVEQQPSLLLNHKVFMSSGHDEYWSGGQRAAVTAARNAGVNLAFFSGNEIFWKTRWANSEDGSNTPYRTLITYKETHYNAVTDPEDPPTWTGAWADPRFSPPADGGNPENALTGQEFEINSGSADIQVPGQFAKVNLWKNTGVASLSPSQTLTLDPGGDMLGYEWDEDLDNGFRPAGELDLSTTTASGLQAFTDYGSLVTNGTSTATHHLTLYRAPSGALVFGAGTVQWSWGLDNQNAWDEGNTDPGGDPPDPNVEQFTVNLLGEMGAQPGTLTSGLVAWGGTVDTTAPTSTINSPSAGQSFADGSTVTVSGTATDSGGGVAAGVEVSTDGGTTWHPATLTTADNTTVSWSYNWIAHGSPSTTVETRAVNDSGYLETPSDAITVNVKCPCSIWGTNVTPQTIDGDDANSAEVGFKFTASVSGQITGIRFYKAAANTGTHVGSLWTASGTLLAQATFTGETASGWQTVQFSSPVSITAGTTYVAGSFDPNGHSSGDDYYFYTPPPTGGHTINSPPLQALQATDTVANGLYSYSSTPTFPTSTYEGANYWVDVIFSPSSTTAPGQVTGVSASAGAQSAAVSWSAPSSGGAPTSYKVTPYIGSTAQTATTVTGGPPATSTTVTGLTAGSSYTFTVQASNSAGSGAVSAQSNSVTPTGATAPGAPTGVSAAPASSQALVSWTAPSSNGGAAISGYTVTPYIGSTAQTTKTVSGTTTSTAVTGLTNGTAYTFKVAASNGTAGPQSSASTAVTPEDTIFDFGVPAEIDSGDPTQGELGVKFTAANSGQITGIRFYKAATNTGTHVGTLWSSTGTQLAQATFTNETASGWQTVLFSSPVSITSGTTYVAGYLETNGHYSATDQGFSSAITNGPLTAVANGTSVNGVYADATTPTFPTNTYQADNYWVDVLFQPTATTAPGQVTGVSATAGSQSAMVSWSAPSSGGAPTSYKITPYIGSTAQTATTITGGPPATSTTVTGLTAGQAYTFTVQASNSAGSGAVSAQSNSVTPTGATAPGAPTGVSASPASSQALVSWTAPSSNGGAAISGYTVTPYIGSTAQTTKTVTGTTTSTTITGLTNGTAYTFKVAATNGTAGPQSTASNTVTAEDTIFDFGVPPALDSGDPSQGELGVKFTAANSGQITGIRFYKAATNTGTHVGTLWSSTGTQLAQATFTNETASGWQTVLFSSPVSITAGSTYVAGYFDPNGHYSVTEQGFSSAITNGPLTAVADSTSVNGVYASASTPTFPTSTYNSENYWIDVLFQPGATTAPGQVTGVSATAGSQSAAVSWSAPSSGGAPTSYKITPYIGSTAQTATTITGGPPATSTTVTGLTAGTAYTFTVQASNSAGSGSVSTNSNSVTPTGATAPGAPTGVTATPASSQALVSWTAPSSNGGAAISGYTVTPYIGSTAQTTKTVTGTTTSTTITGLTNGTAYTFKVAATNGTAGPQSTASNTVTAEDTIFDFGVPPVLDSGDPSQGELGVKFTAANSGQITGIRFYKAATNTGTHVGTLWSSTGTELAQATFTNETASGWQTVLFSSPVSITAGTTYVAGDFDPNGHYSVTEQGFSSAITNGPLTAVASGTSVNGVYAYVSTPTFPTSTYNSENYWIDVLFQP